MRDRETLMKSIFDLETLGLTQEEAISTLRGMFRVRLETVPAGSQLEEEVLEGLSVLNDLIRDTEKK